MYYVSSNFSVIEWIVSIYIVGVIVMAFLGIYWLRSLPPMQSVKFKNVLAVIIASALSWMSIVLALLLLFAECIHSRSNKKNKVMNTKEFKVPAPKNKVKIILSNIFNLPVTRKQVLERAKSYRNATGLCEAIAESLRDYNIPIISLCEIFPKYRYEEAITFGADKDKWGYWWPRYEWNAGRMMFLNWLITEYKDDKTNLRKEIQNIIKNE